MASCLQLFYSIFLLNVCPYDRFVAAGGRSLSSKDSRNGGNAELKFVNKLDFAALQQRAHDPAYEESSTQRALGEWNRRSWRAFLSSRDNRLDKELRGAGINQNEARDVFGEESKRGKSNPSFVEQVRRDSSGLSQSKGHAHLLKERRNFWRGREVQLLKGGTRAWRGKREGIFPLRDTIVVDLLSFKLDNPDEAIRNACCKDSDQNEINGDAETSEEMQPKGGITAWRGKDFGRGMDIAHIAESNNR